MDDPKAETNSSVPTSSQKKESKNDSGWSCPKCGNFNFAFGTVCNCAICDAVRPSLSPVVKDLSGLKRIQNQNVRDKSGWFCPKCGNFNFSFRTVCHRGQCGVFRGASPIPVEMDSIGNQDSGYESGWFCPKCGKFNLAFRAACNRGQCGVFRASPIPRIGTTPIHGASNLSLPLYYGGDRASSLMPFGLASSYGSPFLHPGMRFDYGLPRDSSGFCDLPFAYGPAGLLRGIWNDGSCFKYTQYGLGFRRSLLLVPGTWYGATLPDNMASQKYCGGPNGVSKGWICPKCKNFNYAFREACNMKECQAPRPPSASKGAARPIPERSWTCSKCNNINYPWRTMCNWRGCGNKKPHTHLTKIAQ